jgi:hypothetical protein
MERNFRKVNLFIGASVFSIVSEMCQIIEREFLDKWVGFLL